MLNIVKLFIKLGLCFAKNANVLVALGLLDVGWWHLGRTLLIHGLHAFLARLRLLLGGFLLRLGESGSHLFVLSSFNLG